MKKTDNQTFANRGGGEKQTKRGKALAQNQTGFQFLAGNGCGKHLEPKEKKRKEREGVGWGWVMS